MLSVSTPQERAMELEAALSDGDAGVRRRAAEVLLRMFGIEVDASLRQADLLDGIASDNAEIQQLALSALSTLLASLSDG